MGFSRITAAPLSRPHIQMGLVKNMLKFSLNFLIMSNEYLTKPTIQSFLFASYLTGSTLTGVFKHKVQLPFLGMEFKL